MRRLSVALEELIDPLAPSETGDPGPEQMVVRRSSRRRRRTRPSRVSLFERLEAAVWRLRRRRAKAVYMLSRSEAKGYRIVRRTLAIVAIGTVSFAAAILIVYLTTPH
jgi:hypothetical protein